VIISPYSNILITDKGVVWDKSEGSNFSKIIPLDSNLASYNSQQIKVFKNKETKEINDVCIFLGGVHSTIWSHFLVEYLPKLYYACDSGLFDKPIKVLIPKYNDPHIRKIVCDYISLFPNASLLELDNKYDYKCKRLFHIPIASQASDHADYCLPIDFLLPKNVVNRLKNHLMQYLIPDNHFCEKIYLARRGTYRSMSNWQEAEDYFVSLGFKIVKPHEMTLEEKITTFYNAKIIVGPYSAAFTNLLFCNKSKVLIFSPLMRAYETYYKTIGQLSELNILNVTGTDNSSDIHTSFFVPIEKIKQAYFKLLNG
jgi:capsular polysaccharide biosynthesis protein